VPATSKETPTKTGKEGDEKGDSGTWTGGGIFLEKGHETEKDQDNQNVRGEGRLKHDLVKTSRPMKRR